MHNKIIEIIAEIKENQSLLTSLTEKSSIVMEGGLSSLELLTFIFKIEEEFDIELPFESFDYDLLHSIDGFTKFIENIVAKESA